MTTKSYAEAFMDGLYGMMQSEPRLSIIGRGILGHGAHSNHEKPLHRDFADRITDPPTSEGAVVSMAIGAAMAGERMFHSLGTASFALEAVNQFLHEAAPAHYMSNGQVKVPVTFQMFHGIRGGGAAQHSASPQAMFVNCPGLEVVMPSSAADVKGLIRSAIKSDNPTFFLMHSDLLGVEEDVPDGDYDVAFGVADVKCDGKDVTVVATSRMVQIALQAAEKLSVDGISVEVVDPRTAVPLDIDGICASVEKTGRLVTVDEAPGMCSIGSEIAASVCERAFHALKAPIARVARAHVPAPFSPNLEAFITPSPESVAAAVRKVLM